ncbi:MAG: hypothetical protein IJW46_01735, partial [Clostridia bacterium]|nr:hypothetical protein [Clostridia bacterium]
LLNTLDFTPNVDSASSEAYIPETQPIQNFYPTPEHDIMTDKGYLALDRTLSYSFESQVVSPDNDTLFDSPYDRFFLTYFKALQEGNDTALNDLHSKVYFRDRALFSGVNPQMVYDMEVIRISDEMIITTAETKEDEAYLGASLIAFEVRYKIYQNDGSFRRDIVDTEVIPQVITLLLQKNGTLAINSVSYYRPITSVTPDSDADALLSLIMPLVWLGILVILAVLGVILKKLWAFSGSAAAFCAFLVSIKGALWWQILAFSLVFALIFVLVRLIAKKRAQKNV